MYLALERNPAMNHGSNSWNKVTGRVWDPYEENDISVISFLLMSDWKKEK
jgi:hypothetical protein